jgi:DUF4097 and DUF4098 domain-containing protein YvlB
MSGLCSWSWVALLAVSGGGASYAKVAVTPRTEFRQLYSLGPNGRVTVQNLYGNVCITAWDREDVLVEAVKRSSDPRRLEDARVVVEPSSGSLAIRTLYAGADAQHPPKVEYHITVPRSARLDEVKLGNGGLVISGVTGSVKASSVNGNIRAEKLEGRAELSTINGQVEADFDRIDGAEAISLSSVNGPIRLFLPCGARANLSARNVSGGIDSDFGHPSRRDGAQRLNTTVNHGGTQIRVTNVNGGISIHSTWSHRTIPNSF